MDCFTCGKEKERTIRHTAIERSASASKRACVARANVYIDCISPEDILDHPKSPNSDEDRVFTAEEIHQIVINYLSNPNFVMNGIIGSAQLSCMAKTDEFPMIGRSEVLIEGCHDIAPVIEAIHDPDIKQLWDDMQESGCILSHAGNGLWVKWVAFKWSMGYKGRDFVYNSYLTQSDDSALIVFWSTPTEDVPDGFGPGQKSKVHVRGNILMGGFSITKEDNGIRVVYIFQVDLGVGVPDWVVEATVKKSNGKLDSLRDFLINTKKY